MSSTGNRAVNVVEPEAGGSSVTSNCFDLSRSSMVALGFCRRCGLERAHHLSVVELGSLHVPARDHQAVRPGDTDGERSVVEARALAQHQPGDAHFLAERHRPARRIHQEHPGIIGIEIIAQCDLPRGHGSGSSGLSGEVQVMNASCISFEQIPEVKLRLPAGQADQPRQPGDHIVGEDRRGGSGLGDLPGIQRPAEHLAPLPGP
jgi:hypothetical protein